MFESQTILNNLHKYEEWSKPLQHGPAFVIVNTAQDWELILLLHPQWTPLNVPTVAVKI